LQQRLILRRPREENGEGATDVGQKIYFSDMAFSAFSLKLTKEP